MRLWILSVDTVKDVEDGFLCLFLNLNIIVVFQTEPFLATSYFPKAKLSTRQQLVVKKHY